MKLSQRLSNIHNMIDHEYDHIWDTCCDHGQLGQAIFLSTKHDHIHFVDVMPHLIKAIEQGLSTDSRFFNSNRWSSHAMDCACLPLEEAKNHLVVIAGVGGDLLLKLVKDIMSKHGHKTNIDFILCPVRQLHKVRNGLRQLNLNLIDERLIKEFGHYYEILYVSNNKTGSEVSPIGENMWDLNRKVDQEYLARNLKHYGNMCKQSNTDPSAEPNAQAIYDLYKALKQKSQI